MKRPRDMFDSPISSPPFPSKRRFLSQSMAPSSSPSASRSTPYVLPRQPSCSPWAIATPHDSPSNPFGLNRSLRALTLPRPSGFGKHIVLRLQLVSTADAPRTRGGPSRCHTEDPFRIVQLPLNFSFRLLHMLILFVFASDARLLMKQKRRVFSPPSPIGRKNKGKTRSSKNGDHENEENDEEDHNEEGHLFEVLNDISVCSMVGMRPGQIRAGTGKLYARLSSARERKLFNDPDDEEDDDDVFVNASTKHTTPLAEVEKDAEQGWVWEAEDDFMLSNVWSDGLDLKKGIIYHHTPSTVVHITVNQTRVPGRKGTGNTPHVFVAQGGTNGAIRISNVASGPILLSDDEKENDAAALRKKGKRKTRATQGRKRDHLDELPEEDLEEVSDLAEQETANDDQRERWNSGDAFQRFLKREAARERAMRRHPNPVAPPSPIPPSKSQRSTRANCILAPPSSSPVRYGKLRSQTQSKPSYRYANASAASSAVSLAQSSPSTLPIIDPSSDFDGDLSGWSDYLPEAGEETEHQGPRYSIEIPLQTPFPAHPTARRRIGRVCLRLERQTSRGLSELSDSEDEEGDVDGEEEEGERGRCAEKAARRGGSPSEDATARRAAVDTTSTSNPRPPVPLVRVSAPTPAPTRPPPPVPVPPVVAAEGPDVFEQGRKGDSDCDEGGGDTEADENAHEEGEQNSDDEGWEIGGVWGLGPVPPDWDSEEEV